MSQDDLHRMVRTGVSEAQDTKTNALIPASTLRERVRYLGEMITRSAQTRITKIWEDQDVLCLTQPGPGEKRAAHAWAAMNQAYGQPEWPPENIPHACSRVKRLSEELTGECLRSSAARLSILEALIPDYLTKDEWEALTTKERETRVKQAWERLPVGTTKTEYSHALRQLHKYEHREKVKPTSPYQVLKQPVLKKITIPLSTVDKQYATLESMPENEHSWLLKLLLPECAQPEKTDWSWVQVKIILPEWAELRYGDWEACKPTLQFTTKGLIKVLLPMEARVPDQRELRSPAIGSGLQVRALALDWGYRSLLTGTVVEPGPSVEPNDQSDYVITSGRQYKYNAKGAQLNLYRTREHAEYLGKKIKHLKALLEGQSKDPEQQDQGLRAKLEVLEAEVERQWAHVSERNQQLACHAAKWVIYQALLEDCNLIILEDLRDMITRWFGSRLNGRITTQVRGELLKRVQDLAVLYGIRVILVAPRGTSSYCSRCGERSHFEHAPDKPELRKHSRYEWKGKKHANWLVCACGSSKDRDHSAAERIGARGLALYELLLVEENKLLEKKRATLEKQSRTKQEEQSTATDKLTGKQPSSPDQSSGKPVESVQEPVRLTLKQVKRSEERVRSTGFKTPLVRVKYSPRKISLEQSCSRSGTTPRSVSRGMIPGNDQEYDQDQFMRSKVSDHHTDDQEDDNDNKVSLVGLVHGLEGLIQATRKQAHCTRARTGPHAYSRQLGDPLILRTSSLNTHRLTTTNSSKSRALKKTQLTS